MLKKIGMLFFTSILPLVAAKTAAHTYFFALTELNINTNNQHLEVIHQITAHDIENAIAELKNVNFSPEHPNYEKYIQLYIEEHFQLNKNNQKVKLTWIGLENHKNKIFIYQENISLTILSGLVVKNHLLVDTYSKQINTVNYQDLSIKGSLTFTNSKRITNIE